jgi:hypothetical protein
MSIKAAKQQQPTSRRQVVYTNYNVCIQKPTNLPCTLQHKAAKQQQPTSRREVVYTNYNVCIQNPTNLPCTFQHKDPNMTTLRANLISDQHNQSLIKSLSSIRTGWWRCLGRKLGATRNQPIITCTPKVYPHSIRMAASPF